MSALATIYGVGLGPGDPELMSVKAARLIAKAGVIAHFRKPGRPGNARTLVEGMLSGRRDRGSAGISGHDRDRIR